MKDKPLLRAALLAEKIIEDKAGNLSVITLLDNILMVPLPGRAPAPMPNQMPPARIQLMLLLSFKAGPVRGAHTFGVSFVSPSGKTLIEESDIPAVFEAEDSGVNIVFNVTLVSDEVGLYWLEARWDGEPDPLARMPLRVAYQPQVTQPA